MATIVFTAIGAAIGGPIGGLIGSAIGQRVDNAIFASGKKSEGPRIKELSVQTSSYGTQIPAVFGAMRTAGTVIWSTDLVEKRSSSGGKGRPKTVNYSYSVSMAVALSSRPVARVGRIWAEGNLLRGEQGDFKVETGFRFYSGHADQPTDPLVASAEGVATCPAYRGLSYAVFENLQLADFGNRIPSMTFELFERDGSVLLADIFAEASNGLVVGAPPVSVSGYSLQGGSARAALIPLAEACSAQIRPNREALELYLPENIGAFPGNIEPVLVANQRAGKLPVEGRSGIRRQPVAVSLRYYDPQRDYQAGLQRSGWSTTGNVDEQVDLPAVLDTATARQIAQNIALRRDSRRDSLQLAIATTADRLAIGQSVGAPSMRAAEIEYFSGFSIVRCERLPAAIPLDTGSVDPGRHQPAPDLALGETLLEILEFPSVAASPATEPIIAIAAGGTGPGWRRAAVSQSLDGELSELGSIDAASAIGVLLAPVTAHSPNLIDLANILQIRIDSNGAPADVAATSPLAANAQALMVGNELVRYGSIEQLAGDLFAVRDLLRDCGKTGPTSHVAGERVVFVDRNRLLFPSLDAVSVGTNLEIEAMAIGDPGAVSKRLTISGTATKPLAPVHGGIERLPDGGLLVRWIWRARHDPGWLSGVDLPPVESALRFVLTAKAGANELLRTELAQEELVIAALDVASWNVAVGSAVDLSVRQIGNFGLSDPLNFSFTF